MASAAPSLTGAPLAFTPGRAAAGRWLPRIPGPPAWTGVDRLAQRLAGVDPVVDLGYRIGSAAWWRGFATLGALSGTAVLLALQPPLLLGSVPHRQSPAQLEESRADAIAPLASGGATGRVTPATSAVKRLAEVPERPRIELTARVGAGGLEGALRRSGVGREDLAALRQLLAGIVSPSSLSPGTDLQLVLGRREKRSDPRPIERLDFRAAFELRVEIARGDDGALTLKRVPIAIDETPLRITGRVGRSVTRAARAAGLPAAAINEYVRQMAHVIDFQREVNGDDRFDIIIAHRRAETGETRPGQLLYAGLQNGKKQIELMRWGPRGEFFRADGEGARKGLMRTPVEGARLSGVFGMRFHPILNYSRMHRGIDFAAPTGTPVMAAADGKVVTAGWGGGFGNVIYVDHGKGTVTRYAHLSRIQVKRGEQVRQGQRIGAVGSTGLSTGPHLHYEVWVNGKAVDPRQAKFQSSNQLGGRDLKNFQAEMARLRTIAATE